MDQDPIIVEHEGQRFLVEGGKLVKFTERIIEMPNSPVAIQAKISENCVLLREEILKYIAKNDPFSSI